MGKVYMVSDGKLVLQLRRAKGEKYYTVTAPFEPEVITQGRTLEEAFAMARDASALLAKVRREEQRRGVRRK